MNSGTRQVAARYRDTAGDRPVHISNANPANSGTRPVPAKCRLAFKMPTPTYPGPGRPLPGTETQPVTDRFAYELSTRTQPVFDRVMDDPPDMPTPVHRYDQLSPKTELYDYRPPEADLMDTVMQLQLEVDMLTIGGCQSRQRRLRRLCWFSLNQRHLHPPKCLSSVGRLVGTSIDKCLMLLFGRMGGTTPYNSCLTWRGTH